MAIAALLIHPISGIPALVLVTVVSLELLRDKLSFSPWLIRSLYLEIIVLGSLALPACFLLFGLLSDQSTVLRSLSAINLDSVRNWMPFDTLSVTRSPRPLMYEIGYFVVEHIWWLLSACTIPVALWLLAKNKQSLLRVYLLTSLAILGNAFFLSTFIEFPNVIAYESHQYPTRLLSMAFWTLLPFLMIGLIWLYRSIRHQSVLIFWTVTLGVVWLIVGTVYLSYPRQNRYEIGRQYSTSAHDFEAVRKIAKQNKADYVVLANQSVSAAAIATSGFKTYFHDPEGGSPIFYYPLPTASPLYEIYLDMVYDAPSRKNAEQAHALTGVQTVYFVLNDYWENAPTLKALAKMEADEWMEIGNGRVTVFTYRFDLEGPKK
jgi:hypothetical protein